MYNKYIFTYLVIIIIFLKPRFFFFSFFFFFFVSMSGNDECSQISQSRNVWSSVLLEMLEWKLVGEKVGIDSYNMNAYTQVATLTGIFRICYF